MKIRTYLLLMIGAIIVPVFLLAAIALRTLLQAEREAALHTLSETASATALLVDRELGSAEAALRVLARQAHPVLAIVDIGLPGMDGYQIAAALRAEPALAAMRLLALTGYGQPADRERALAAGFDRHYVKPLSPDQLEAVLEELRTSAG